MARSNNDAPKKVVSVAGIVGSDPEVKSTDYGDVAEFRLAVTTSYDEDAESKWFDVSVWNEGLIDSVESELFRGAKVAVEGTYSVREYEGKEYPKISAARVGLVDWLQRSKSSGSSSSSKPARRSRDEDEEERPARRSSSRGSSNRSRSSGSSTRSARPAKDDTEDDDLPW